MSLLKQDISLFGDNIPWFEGLREKARKAFERIGLPTAKTEAWKYSYFKEDALNKPQIDETPHECDGHCHDASKLPFAAVELKYCNGKLTHIAHDLPCGIIIRPLYEATEDGEIKPYLNKSFDMEEFPFAALNTAFLDEGLFIVITAGTVLNMPIYLHYHQHSGMNRLCNIRNIIVIEKGAKATLIEDFDGESDARYFDNIVNEIYVGTGAILQHYKRQNEASEAHHVAFNSVQVKSGGKYESLIAHGECALARTESYVRLTQENASAEVNGVYRLAQNGVSDITTNIRHLAPHTDSDQLVKGVLDGKAKGVFQGQIHIAPDAQQTTGYQLHRALVLSDGAEVDCKPELEIFADDVKCSHGATSGDLDAEQLFYMQARGIPLAEARQILIEAYLNEVFEKVEDTAVAEWLKGRL
ncbi:MAG: Fe-S cluster assembly protein SufD [Alphaproteobacteria bacterium]|nr:Fe-S cluster assembly protein SufD [Alphaproteobacteria bacterium]